MKATLRQGVDENDMDYSIRTASVVVESERAEIWTFNKEFFIGIMNDTILAHLKNRIELRDKNIEFTDLKAMRVIGKGGFGVVTFVKHKVTKARYALKALKRKDIIELNAQDTIRAERNILAEVDHPFLLKFVRTFKDNIHIFILTEIVSGGDFLNVLDKYLGKLNKSQTQFYTGSIVLALEYMHSNSIIYRDLKPENMLLDMQGYLKIIDFGIAKKLKTLRTFTCIGTPHFMAPEVIQGKGYTCSVDLFSLGVVIHELMLGTLPFGNKMTNNHDVWYEILRKKVRFPGNDSNKGTTVSSTASDKSSQLPSAAATEVSIVSTKPKSAMKSAMKTTSTLSNKTDDATPSTVAPADATPGSQGDKTPASVYTSVTPTPESSPSTGKNKTPSLGASAKNVILGLLEKKPEKRLTIQKVKHHSFFRDFAWDGLLQRTIEPPWKPQRESYSMNTKENESDIYLVDDEYINEGGMLTADEKQDVKEVEKALKQNKSINANWDEDF